MKKPKLTAALDHQFRQILAAAEHETFGERIPDPAEQVALVEQIIEQVRAGWTVHNGQWIQVVVARPEGADLAGAAAEARQARRGPSRRVLLGGIGAALLAVWVGVRLLSPDPAPAPAPGLPLARPPSAGATATGLATATPLPVPTVGAGFVAGGGEAAWPRHPNSLTIAGRTFGVYQAPVVGNVWQVSFNPGLANWIKGATLNWSFALYLDGPDAATAAWIAALQPGQTAVEIPIVEADQHIHVERFAVAERRGIARTDTEIFDPRRAGVTVVIPQTPGDQWIELHATRVTDPAALPSVGPTGGPGGDAYGAQGR